VIETELRAHYAKQIERPGYRRLPLRTVRYCSRIAASDSYGNTSDQRRVVRLEAALCGAGASASSVNRCETIRRASGGWRNVAARRIVAGRGAAVRIAMGGMDVDETS
jgi:hypothetical protein